MNNSEALALFGTLTGFRAINDALAKRRAAGETVMNPYTTAFSLASVLNLQALRPLVLRLEPIIADLQRQIAPLQVEFDRQLSDLARTHVIIGEGEEMVDGKAYPVADEGKFLAAKQELEAAHPALFGLLKDLDAVMLGEADVEIRLIDEDDWPSWPPLDLSQASGLLPMTACKKQVAETTA